MMSFSKVAQINVYTYRKIYYSCIDRITISIHQKLIHDEKLIHWLHQRSVTFTDYNLLQRSCICATTDGQVGNKSH